MDNYDAFVGHFLTNLKNSLSISKDMLLEDLKKMNSVPLFPVSQGKSTSFEPFPYEVSTVRKIMHPTKEQADSFARTNIEPTQTMRGKPVLDLPNVEKGFLKMASSFKESENRASKLILCDENDRVKPTIQPRQNHFYNSYWIVKNRVDFQREAFGQRVINVTNGTRFYFDDKQNCNVYESWATIPTVNAQKILGLNTTDLEESEWIINNLGLPYTKGME